VMSTSAAGLFGNFGQTNYSAAKMGQLGFMNTLKLEGAKYDIKVNAVAPVAATRLTQDVLPPDLFEKMKPEFVAPLVLYLVSEECPVSGCVYNAGMGYYGRAAMVAGPPVVAAEGGAGQVPTPEDLAGKFEAISSLQGLQEFEHTTNFFGFMLEALQPKAAGAAAAPVLQQPAKGGGMTVAGVFEQMPAHFQKGAAAGVSVVFQFKISGEGGGDWSVEVKDQACAVKAGVHPKPTTTILMAAGDFLDLMQGKLNAMKAYTGKKLKIEGDLMKSQLVEKLFKLT